VNGYGTPVQKTANGLGCLAAFVVSRFKKATGNIYLAPMNDSGNDYMYTVKHTKKGLTISVKEWGNLVFSGSLDEFITFCKIGE